MSDLMVIINMLALVYLGWFVERSLQKNKSKMWLFSGLVVVMLVILFTLPNYGPTYSYIMVTTILMYLVLTVSWALFSGPTGYISLAPAAFFGVGIYTSAVLGKDIPLLAVVLLGGILSFVLAMIVGALTLRLKGTYFIMFTFGLVLLITNLLLWYEIKFTGTRGRFVVAAGNDTIYYVMLGIFILLLITAFIIKRSKFGLALQSIGQNEEAAAHMGINVTGVKVIVFAITAFFMGMAGAIMTMKWTYIDPFSAFDLFRSFLPVLMAIFGGMRYFYGPVLGSVIFAYLEEKLLTEFPYVYKLAFGIVLIAVILYLPDGLAGLVDKIRARIARKKNALT